MVNLANADDTSDLAKPISTATQTALSVKAPLHTPTFFRTCNREHEIFFHLSNVDDTSDLATPISTATQTALKLKHHLILLHVQEL